MPIVSKTLTKLANREDIQPGWKKWRIEGIDALGRKWTHGSFGGTQAYAEAELTKPLWNLAAEDFAALLQWVQNLNAVADFDYNNRDITQADGEEYIFQWFAEAEGADAISVAWWMDDINTGKFNSIRDRIGYTGAQGSDITSRFTFMVSVEPWYNRKVRAP